MKLKAKSSVFTPEEYFSQLIDHSEDVFWVRDAEMKTQLYVNQAYQHLWGLTCKSLYADGTSWFSAVYSDDRDKLREQLEKLKNNPENANHIFSYRIIDTESSVKKIRELIFPIYDKKHTVKAFAGIAKNITMGLEHLSDLEQVDRFFEVFSEKTNAVFWARDYSSNKQLFLSPAYEKLWGRSRTAIFENPESWINTVHPEDRDKVSTNNRLELLYERGTDFEFEYIYRIYTPTGELRWVKDTSCSVQDKKNNLIGFAGVAQDITEEVLREQELLEAKKRAEIANQVKSDFLAMVSHELRTPLNAILGITQILKNQPLPKDYDEYIDIIHVAGENLVALVSEILDFARVEAGKLTFSNEPFNLRELFEQIVRGLQYQANEKNIQLTLNYPAVLVSHVIGDEKRVRQILINLIGNAIKFTEKGHVEIRVDSGGLQDSHGSHKKDSTVLFEIIIKDTGIGIPADKLEFIFEKFSQIDSVYERKKGGVGLGLAISKQLIDAMNGKIEVCSEFGRGTEFKLSLPFELQQINDETQLDDEMEVQLFTKHYPHRIKVLLVEDNITNQKIAKIILEDLGCIVDIVENGVQVMEKIDSLTQYEIIFMDIGLPDINGFEIAKQLRKIPTLKKIPMVAMTAHVMERDRQYAREAGLDRMIAKPISYKEIAKTLKIFAKK